MSNKDHIRRMVIMGLVSGDVQEEIQNQVKKWGERDHDLYTWLVILMKEVGEASQAALKVEDSKGCRRFREELIHVAAVAMAAVGSIDFYDI